MTRSRAWLLAQQQQQQAKGNLAAVPVEQNPQLTAPQSSQSTWAPAIPAANNSATTTQAPTTQMQTLVTRKQINTPLDHLWCSAVPLLPCDQALHRPKHCTTGSFSSSSTTTTKSSSSFTSKLSTLTLTQKDSLCRPTTKRQAHHAQLQWKSWRTQLIFLRDRSTIYLACSHWWSR